MSQGAQWTGKTWTAQVKGNVVRATSEQLAAFRDLFVQDQDLASRMSELLWFDIFVLSRVHGINPQDFLASIMDVETGETASHGVKSATQFNRLPLRGLWHKHFFSAHFLVQNILLALGPNGLQQMVDDVFDNGEPVVTQEMISELAHKVANDPASQRNQAKKLTGEWIVFLKREGKNYWLCINTHNAGDQMIYDRIAEHCIRTFPDIQTWLTEAAR